MSWRDRFYEWMVRQSRENIEKTKETQRASGRPRGENFTQKMDDRLKRHEKKLL